MISSSKKRRHRALWLLAGFLLLLGCVGAVWWFVWVPNWRPSLDVGERYGVDVSAHQGVIDWEAVAADDIEFAYIKATEGGDFVDEYFQANWMGAQRAGLDRGVYHFFTLCTPGEVQAENFLRVAPPDSQALAPAVDLELAGNCSGRPPARDMYEELNAFINKVERAWKREIVLYLGADFEEQYGVKGRLDRPLWLRRFLIEPGDRDWYIWQLHGYALIDGIKGGADLDVMRPTALNHD